MHTQAIDVLRIEFELHTHGKPALIKAWEHEPEMYHPRVCPIYHQIIYALIHDNLI